MKMVVRSMFKKTPTRRAVGMAGLIVSALFASACGQTTTTDVSDTLHNTDEPVRGTESWMWAATTDQQYISVVGPLVGISAGDILPTSNELTKRTQFWLDKIDAAVRSEHPDQMVNVPKPRAKIKIDDSVNAFVAPASVCYTVKVKLSSGTQNASNTAEKVLLDLQTGEFSAWPGELTCIEGGAAATEAMAQVVEHFNAVSNRCKINLQGVGATATVVPNSDCRLNDDISGVVGAKNLVLLAGANHVTVHTALFAAMTEKSFVAVLAHELGHYYRAHISAPEALYDFFYKLERNAAPVRPTPDASLKAIGDAAYAASSELGVGDNFSKVADQSLRSELYLSVGTIIKKVCAAGSCSTACKAAATYNSSSATSEVMGTFPFGGDAATRDAYPEFETKALACLSDLKLASGSNVLNATSVSWDRLVGSVRTPTWPSWLTQISPDGQKYVSDLNAVVASRLGTTAPNAANNKLDSVFAAMVARLNEYDATQIAKLKEANDQHVGQYTAEQEADEVSVEWISDLGIEPSNAVEAMRSLGAGSPTGLGGFLLGSRDCDTLFSNDWLDANGEYRFVPVGDFSEVHHSICYRMFNMEREIDAHQFSVVGQQNTPVAPGATWASIQAQASRQRSGQRTQPAYVAGSVSTLTPGVKKALKTNFESCVYAPRFK